ncbi:MAG: hypothetical protein ABSB68_06435 [Acidimicrobiales bacterium]|jgi:hypothetical protein
MARALVFVDDAVRGRLPDVCAKTGVATDDRLVQTVPVGGSEGFGVAWLLVLAGPIGWLGLFVYAMVRRVETLTVRLPYCDEAYAELQGARRLRRISAWASGICVVLALLALRPGTFTAQTAGAALAAVGLGFLVLAVVETRHVRRASVGVDLDGSRRWVSLDRVSDAFAAAVVAREESDRARI